MRILLLATAATVLSGCSFYDQAGTYGASHTISPYATSGIYAGCVESTYTGCAPQQAQDPCAVTYMAANQCGTQSYGEPVHHQTYGQQTHQGQQNNTQDYYGHNYYNQPQSGSNCVEPCGTGYYSAPQTATSYAVSHAAPGHYGTQYHQLRGPYDIYGRGHHARSNRGFAYGELGVRSEFGIENVDPIFDAVGRIGYQTSSFLGFEIEGSKGVVGDDVLVDVGMGPEAADFKLDTSYAGFAVARAPMGQVDAYIRAGYHESKYTVEVESSGAELETKDRGAAVGGGVEVPVSKSGYLRGDVTYYENGAGADEDVWATSITYQHRF